MDITELQVDQPPTVDEAQIQDSNIQMADAPIAPVVEIPRVDQVAQIEAATESFDQAIQEVQNEIADDHKEPFIRDKSKGKVAVSSSYGLIPSPERSSSSDADSYQEAKDF